jgi:hypothetical protein
MGTEPSPPSRLYARSMWPVKYMATSVTTAPAALSWTGGQGMMRQDATKMQWGMMRQEEGRRGEEEKGVRRYPVSWPTFSFCCGLSDLSSYSDQLLSLRKYLPVEASEAKMWRHERGGGTRGCWRG